MKEFQWQMDQFRKSMPELFKFDKHQLEQFRREIEPLHMEAGQKV